MRLQYYLMFLYSETSTANKNVSWLKWMVSFLVCLNWEEKCDLFI